MTDGFDLKWCIVDGRLSSGSSGGEEEMRKKRSKTTKDKPTASRVGGAHEEGCVSVSGEKRDVVKACHVLPSSSSSLEKERAMQRVATRAGACVCVYACVCENNFTYVFRS